MPHHWIRVSTGTPSRLVPYVDDPQGFERELGAIAEECGGAIDGVFFDRNGRYAYALVHDTGGRLDLDSLDEVLTDDRDGKPERVDLETPGERARRKPAS